MKSGRWICALCGKFTARKTDGYDLRSHSNLRDERSRKRIVSFGETYCTICFRSLFGKTSVNLSLDLISSPRMYQSIPILSNSQRCIMYVLSFPRLGNRTTTFKFEVSRFLRIAPRPRVASLRFVQFVGWQKKKNIHRLL